MSDLLTAKQVREDRHKLAKQAQEILKDNGGKLEGENREKFDVMMVDVDAKEAQAIDLERVETVIDGMDERQQQEMTGMARHVPKTQWDGIPTDRDKEFAFRAWMSPRETRVQKEYGPYAEKCGLDINDNKFRFKLASRAPKNIDEARSWAKDGLPDGLQYRTTTMQTLTTGVGGDVVPNAAMAAIEVALLSHEGMRSAGATVLRTASGASLPIPVSNDTTEVATIIGETSAVDVKNIKTGQRTLGAFKYSSGMVQVSRELLQDSNMDMSAFVAGALGIRVARGLNADFTIGESSNTGPNGPAQNGGAATVNLGQAIVGATVATTATTGAIGLFADWLNLIHSIDRVHRPNSKLMFNDTTLKELKKLADSQGRPLWIPGISAREPDTFLGEQYVVNNDVVTPVNTSGGNPFALYGDFSKYWIRDVAEIELLRLDERFAELGVTAFLTFSRHDGLFITGSTLIQSCPIASLVSAAT